MDDLDGDDRRGDWQVRVDAVWDDTRLDDDERVRLIDALASERDRDDPLALYERAGARDVAGHEADAEPLYRAALRAGLDPLREVRAIVQLASTLRNLGRVEESLAMLEGLSARTRGHALADSVTAFHALALISAGRDREAAVLALRALAAHLPEYRRSVGWYLDELAPPR